MKWVLFFLIGFSAANSISAQVNVAYAPEVNYTDYHAYYFKKYNYLRQDIHFDDSKRYTQKDSLELFIADSIQFHNQYKYYYQTTPHACQNRLYKFGFINADNEMIIPFEYDAVQLNFDSMMLVTKGNAQGIIDYKNKIIIPFGNAFFYLHKNNLVALTKPEADSLVLFYNQKGEFLFSTNGYWPKKMNDKYIYIATRNKGFKGVVDFKGKWIVQPGTYDNVTWIGRNMVCAYKNGKYGIANLNGDTIIPFEYDNITPAYEGQFIVYKNRKAAVVDSKNHFIIPFDNINIENLGKLYTVGKYLSDTRALVDYHGVQLLEEKYNISFPDQWGENKLIKTNRKRMLLIRDPSTYLFGMYNEDGIQILPVEYTDIRYKPGFEAITLSKKNGATGLVYGASNRAGKIIVPFSTNPLYFIDRSPGLLYAKNEKGLTAFASATTGGFFTAYEFNGIEFLYTLPGGFIAAKKNWLYALISPEGKLLTGVEYSSFYPPSKKSKEIYGAEVVCEGIKNNKAFGITKTGKEIPAIK